MVGAATIKELIAQGHVVSALARSDKSAAKLKQLGVSSVLTGSTQSLDVLKQGAENADAVIHTAFDHESFGDPQALLKACEDDRLACQAMCNALLESSSPDKPKVMIYTSGLMGDAGPDETSGKIPNDAMPRHLSDELIHSYSAKGLRTIIVRLAPVVHGPGYEHPFIMGQVEPAKKHGFAAYIGDGQQQWYGVHVDDAATLLCLALTKGPSGSNFHCFDDAMKVKDVVERVAARLGVPSKSIAAQDAYAHFQSAVTFVLMSDLTATKKLTEEWTGWQPKGYSVFKEMEGYKI